MSVKHLALLLALAMGVPAMASARRRPTATAHRNKRTRKVVHREQGRRSMIAHRTRRHEGRPAAERDATPAPVIARQPAPAAPAPPPPAALPRPQPVAAKATEEERLQAVVRRLRDLQDALSQAEARVDALKSNLLDPPPAASGGAGPTVPSI